MGLWDYLFGRQQPSNILLVPDRIWMTTDAKFAGLARDAEDRSHSESVAILLVAHFPDVLARLQEVASKQVWDVPCQAVPASHLNADLAASLRLDKSAIIEILVGERHPLPSVDDRLAEFANELPCRCRFAHHVSLDDAVMQRFAGESVKNMLKQMGMKEDEAIESRMVSRRIRKAQQKIEGRTSGDLDAESAWEWLKKNCPEPSPH